MSLQGGRPWPLRSVGSLGESPGKEEGSQKVCPKPGGKKDGVGWVSLGKGRTET